MENRKIYILTENSRVVDCFDSESKAMQALYAEIGQLMVSFGKCTTTCEKYERRIIVTVNETSRSAYEVSEKDLKLERGVVGQVGRAAN